MEPNSVKPYTIVVGVDYSETGEAALRRAFELASLQERAEVHVVNVVKAYGSNVYLELSSAITLVPIDEASDRLRRYVEQQLDVFRSAQENRGRRLFERAVTHVRIEGPAEEIAQLASDLEADLVVVGTHGRRGLRRLLLGSVAEAVVRLAPAPVLVVRPKESHGDSVQPHIEPPCPRCVAIRRESRGHELWCDQHREHEARRHTYHYTDPAEQVPLGTRKDH